jgi:hypothetical protein
MTKRERLLLGGLGGITPFFAQLLILDPAIIGSWFANLFHPDIKGLTLILGYLFRGILLFSLGVLWAHLHKSERSKLKIYQLGIVAPAIIAGLIHKDFDGNRNLKGHLGAGIQIVSSAFAAENSNVLDNDTKSSHGFVSRFVDGFFSRDVVARVRWEEKEKLRTDEISNFHKTIAEKTDENSRLKESLIGCFNERDSLLSRKYELNNPANQMVETQKSAHNTNKKMAPLKISVRNTDDFQEPFMKIYLLYYMSYAYPDDIDKTIASIGAAEDELLKQCLDTARINNSDNFSADAKECGSLYFDEETSKIKCRFVYPREDIMQWSSDLNSLLTDKNLKWKDTVSGSYAISTKVSLDFQERAYGMMRMFTPQESLPQSYRYNFRANFFKQRLSRLEGRVACP